MWDSIISNQTTYTSLKRRKRILSGNYLSCLKKVFKIWLPGIPCIVQIKKSITKPFVNQVFDIDWVLFMKKDF